MKSIDSAQAGLMLQAAARRIIESKPRLTELDGKIGDGDHGIGMALGMEKAEAALAALPEDATVNERFIAVGKAMLTSMAAPRESSSGRCSGRGRRSSRPPGSWTRTCCGGCSGARWRP